MVYLMLLCGLRSREVRSVRLVDVDFDEHRLRVRGKGNKERIVPLPSTLVLVIRRYLDLERPSCCASDTLFVVLQGKRAVLRSVKKPCACYFATDEKTQLWQRPTRIAFAIPSAPTWHVAVFASPSCRG